MVIKGNARAGAKSLAAHVLRGDTNELVKVEEIRGVVSEDVEGALREMEAVACCTNTRKPLYHASINTPVEERMTPEQRARAIDRLEEALNLTGQPRVVVIHEKKGREHCHIIWSRTDLEKSIAIRMDHNFRTHEIVARELEREFGHERVQGAHVERDGKPRPARTPGHDEMQQAARTGLKAKEAKEQITALWRATDSGQAFQAAIEEKGWILARGDRRDFVVVDPQGGTHSLARRIDGAKAKDVRERMADLDASALPTAQEARAMQAERLAERKPPEPDFAEDKKRRHRAGVGWTRLDRPRRHGGAGAFGAQMGQGHGARAGPIEPPAGKTLNFSEDRNSSPKPVTKPERESGEKRLKFFEDKKPDKDIDRDR